MGVGAAPPRREITALTSLRGLAAWWVALYHFASVRPFPGVMGRFISQGDVAVDIFFVMSGFVLTMSYGGGFGRGVTAGGYVRFLTIRLGRIYPLHLVVLGLFVLIPLTLYLTGRPSLPGRYPLDYFIESLFLIQNWGFAERLAWNPPAWSISTELLFYLVFPVLAYGVGALMRGRAGLLIVGVLALAALMAHQALPRGLFQDLHRLGGVLRCLTEGFLGIWLFHFAQRFPPGRISGMAVLVGCVALAMVYDMGIGRGLPLLPLAFAGLVWALLEPGHIVGRVLALPVLRWLGEISFSTYLIHYFIKDIMKLTLMSILPGWALLPVFVALVLAASVVLHHLIEEPGRKFGRRLAARLFAAPPARPLPLATRAQHH